MAIPADAAIAYSPVMIRLTAFQNKTVGVFGLGGSGRAAAAALVAGGARVVGWDDSEASRDTAVAAGVVVTDFRDLSFQEFDSLVIAPGVPLTHPEPHWTVKAAHEAGVEVIGDIELFLRQRAVDAPAAPFIAITGTNGKSTTTALVTHVLRALGCKVSMGGNIGKAILSVEPPAADVIHVVEMSSYQIDLTPSLAPTVGILLNVTPDHLDRHGSLENYANIKARLVKSAERACVCVDDAITRRIAGEIDPSKRLYAFTKGKGASVVPRAYAIGSTLFAHSVEDGIGRSEEIAGLDAIPSLRGAHNVENALAAVVAVRALAEHDLETGSKRAESLWRPGRIADALKSFPGLAHRLQPVARRGHVVFVNDSKATNAESAEKALASFDGGIFWIAGGRAKDGGIDALAPLFPRLEKAYLIGEASDEFAQTLSGRAPYERAGTMQRAVAQAARDAELSTSSGAVVLLSPACASFDQYQNFEVRGDHFVDLVSALPDVEILGGKP